MPSQQPHAPTIVLVCALVLCACVLFAPAAPTHAAPLAPSPSACARPCNPWGYNFQPGTLIYSPPARFCSYFRCIPTFADGKGFVNQCVDRMYSKSGGIRGDCSHHGGELRPLYSH